MSIPTAQLSVAEVKTLLASEVQTTPASRSLRTLAPSDDLYQRVEKVLDGRLKNAAHSFRLAKMEVVSAPASIGTKFKKLVSDSTRPCFLFHGTDPQNHTGIFDKGFIVDESHHSTDEGFIGVGVYLSPDPEYASAYISNVDGIGRLAYYEPVKVGVTAQVLGCITLVAPTKRLEEKKLGCKISSNLKSHWAIVASNGSVLKESERGRNFAVEYAVRDGAFVYPRFKLSLTRVTREVIWVDPNINNEENTKYVRQLKQVPEIYFLATTSADEALLFLRRKKPDTEYRAITAGRGGEQFVNGVRSGGIHCRVLVFCGAVDYHKTWAKKFENTEVTKSTQEMINFATWKG